MKVKTNLRAGSGGQSGAGNNGTITVTHTNFSIIAGKLVVTTQVLTGHKG